MLGFYKTSKSDIKDGEQTECCYINDVLQVYKRVLVSLYVLRLNSFMIIKNVSVLTLYSETDYINKSVLVLSFLKSSVPFVTLLCRGLVS